MSKEKLQTLVADVFKAQSSDELMNLYSNIADDYDKLIHENVSQSQRKVVEAVRSLTDDKNVKILDLCAGTGLDGMELFSAGYKNIYAHDGCEKLLEIAQKKNIYKEIYCELLYPDRFSSKVPRFSFDIVVAVGCFVPAHLTFDYLPVISDLLKDGGYLVIITRYVE